MKTYTLKLKAALLAVSLVSVAQAKADEALVAPMMEEIKQTFTALLTLVDDFTNKSNKAKLPTFTEKSRLDIEKFTRIITKLKEKSEYSGAIRAMHKFAQKNHKSLYDLYVALEAFNASSTKKAVTLATVLKGQLTHINAEDLENLLNEIYALLVTEGCDKSAKEIKDLITQAKRKIEEIKKRVADPGFLTVLKQRL